LSSLNEALYSPVQPSPYNFISSGAASPATLSPLVQLLLQLYLLWSSLSCNFISSGVASPATLSPLVQILLLLYLLWCGSSCYFISSGADPSANVTLYCSLSCNLYHRLQIYLQPDLILCSSFSKLSSSGAAPKETLSPLVQLFQTLIPSRTSSPDSFYLL
jgi:hypothetical protein